MGSAGESLTRQLGLAIREKRRQLGLTQEQLAEKIGIAHQGLSRIEQGHMAPKMDRLPVIAQNLNCSVADLFRHAVGEESLKVGEQVDELLEGVPLEKKKFILGHISSLVSLLKNL